jgi:hypothetical protein
LQQRFAMTATESNLAAASFLAGKDSVVRIYNELTWLMMELGKRFSSHA